MADNFVWPRRDLPGASDQWGRTAETRVDSNQAAIEALEQAVQSQNRNAASSLAVLGEAIKAIPITTSRSAYATDFAIPAVNPNWTTTAQIQIDNPPGRNRLSLFCVGNVRIYESVSPPASFAQVILRAYSTDTGILVAGGGSSPTIRSAQVTDTLHSATPVFATRFTTPPGGIYVTLEIQTTNPPNFPLDTRNLAELVVQTSFL